jgi:hypothetical protein
MPATQKKRRPKGTRRGDSSGEEEDGGLQHSSRLASKKQSMNVPQLSSTSFIEISVDPVLVRFAHSRIRPVFSGCGRSLEGTLAEIRSGQTKPSDLPMITVIQGPCEQSQTWYFSLNNRRLWVLKACKEEGLLANTSGLIRVRARGPKKHEVERYTLVNCANTATFLREKLAAAAADGDAANNDEDAAATEHTQV